MGVWGVGGGGECFRPEIQNEAAFLAPFVSFFSLTYESSGPKSAVRCKINADNLRRLLGRPLG